MRSLHYTHNLPAIADKNSTHRVLPFTSIHNSSVLFFCSVQELILNIESIPLSLSLDSNDFKGIEIMVTTTSLVLKYQLQSLNLPLNVAKQKWLRISFGQEISKIEVRPQQNQNKLDRTHFYSKVQLWKKEERKETAALYTVPIETYITVLKNKNKLKQKADGVDNDSRKDISRYLKMKLIERTNPTNNKPKLQPLTAKQSTNYGNSYAEEHQKSKNKTIIYQKYESATLDFNQQIVNKDTSNKRDVNTSNSVRSEPTGIRFSRHLNRLRDPKSRISKNKDSESSTEISQFIPIANHRPKFYQQISLSHEQIELKRRKFDSQFIHKQKVDLADKSTVAQKDNESEVKQEIHKMENSKIGSHIQDTFERGMFQNNNAQNNEQSGTLCESVFE